MKQFEELSQEEQKLATSLGFTNVFGVRDSLPLANLYSDSIMATIDPRDKPAVMTATMVVNNTRILAILDLYELKLK